WNACGEVREGRLWLERLLAADQRPSRDRMRALAAYGRLLILLGAPATAVDVGTECLTMARRFDDRFHVSHSLQTLGLSRLYLGDLAAARQHLEDAVAQAREVDDGGRARAFTLLGLAMGVLLANDDPVRSAELYAEVGAICRAHGEQWWLGYALFGSVPPALRLGDVPQAAACGREALEVRRALRDSEGVAMALQLLSWVAAAAHDHPRAARLLGATDRYWRTVGGSPFAGQWRRLQEDYELSIRQALGPRYDMEFRHGGRLSLDEGVAYALGEDHAVPTDAARTDPRLTPREAQIAALVAQGLGNKQIAS